MAPSAFCLTVQEVLSLPMVWMSPDRRASQSASLRVRLVGEAQVDRPRLAPHPQAAPAGGPQRLRRARAGHVDDVDLGVHQLRVVDHPTGGFHLGERGPAVRVVARVGAAGRDQVGLRQIEHVAVLAVHVEQRAGRARRPHHAQQGLIGQAELADREHLDAREPRAHQPGQLLQDRVGGLGEDHVEAIVHVGATLGLGLPGVDRAREGVALRLPGVVADRGDAAACRRRGAGLEVVRGAGAAQVEVQMGVHVHPAGDDHEAARVDLLAVLR